MKKKYCLILFVFTFFLVVELFANEPRPNIIIIKTDELRWDALGYAGNTVVKTPNIDALANQGATFRNAHCVTPLCGPSRYSFFTGKYPHVTGKLTNKSFDFIKPTDFSFTSLLKNEGYTLGHAGKNDTWSKEIIESDFSFWEAYRHHGKHTGTITDSDKAIVEYFKKDPREGEIFEKAPMMLEGLIDEAAPFKPEEWPTYRLTSDAIDFVEGNLNTPFFLHLSYPGPHWPQVVPEPYYSMYDIKDIELEASDIDWTKNRPFKHFVQSKALGVDKYTTEESKKMLAVYYGQISFIDTQIGRFLTYLKNNGRFENSIIVFTADHGDFAGRYNLVSKTGGFHEPLIRIPLVVKLPGKNAVRVTDANISNIDVMPTIMDYLNIPFEEEINGKSFLDVVKGKSNVHREAIFAEVGSGEPSPTPVPYDSYDAYAEQRAKRDGMFWFIEYTVKGKAVMIKRDNWKYVFYRDDTEELYNLNNDPLEMINLAGKAEYDEIEDKLQTELFEWYLSK